MVPSLLLLLLTASPPDAALLDKLAERSLQLEAFTNGARVKLEVLAEELDGDGAVKKTTVSTLRVARAGGTVQRTLLRYLENGKDLTEAKRKELEQVPKKNGGVRSPFHPDQRAKYAFTVLAPPEDKPGLLRVGFEPLGEPSDQLYRGSALVDPASGDVRALSMRPSKTPALVQSVSVEATLDAATPAGRAMSRLTMQGVTGVLFFKSRFRVVTTFSEYEAL